MHKLPFALSAASLLLLLCSGCDNVGRAFDRNLTPSDPGTGSGTSTIQVVPVGGEARDGVPTVKATFPSGGGWPLAVPIAVEFSESVNESSIVPTTPAGVDGLVVLRVKNTTQPLPCQYDLIANGRLLIMRPVQPLSNVQNPSYEVVMLPDARDVDGVRFNVPTGGTVLSEFQVNQAETFVDGRILTTFPRDNAREVVRETGYFVVFDRPANAASVVEANLFVRPQGGIGIAATLGFPVKTLTVDDPRVVSVQPTVPLNAATTYQLVVNDAITFGTTGKLDFLGRTPFAEFRTTGPAAPTLVELGNPTQDFPNKINQQNTANAVLHVTTPDDAQVGDKVRARIYGGDARTTPTGDLAFVERSVTLAAAGPQVVTVDFAGALGTLTGPRFDDGSITFAAQMRRGSAAASGFIQNAANANPSYDVTQPTLVTVGPPAGANGTDILSDVEYVAFHGTASEALQDATLVGGSLVETVAQFAVANSGRFLMLPIAVGRQPAPVPFSLTFRDRAGNMVAGAVTGNFVQRGMVTGTLTDTLVVEAYDQATLLPVAGATVLVDPGVPVSPASGQLVGTTGADGRVSFSVGNARHTVTIVRAGFDLITFYDTAAAFVSLPLRPTSNATATFRGTLVVASAPGATAVVGNSAVDDRSPLGIRTANSAPTTIPDTAIIPNRAQVVTAFSGVIEPTASPAFAAQGFQMFGATLSLPTPPTAPTAAGAIAQPTITLLSSENQLGALLGAYDVDFSQAAGLDFANLVDSRPIVRATMALKGFEGQALIGLGYATPSGSGLYSVSGNFGFVVGGFVLFVETLTLAGRIVCEARDTSGNVSRHRRVFNTESGQFLDNWPALAIPTITPPTAASTGSPAIEFRDVLDAGLLSGLLSGLGRAIDDVVATDGANRRWRLLRVDRDGSDGTATDLDTVQFPDLATAGVGGLQAGNWSVQVEARLWAGLDVSGDDDLMLTERIRQELLYGRCAAVTFTVQ